MVPPVLAFFGAPTRMVLDGSAIGSWALFQDEMGRDLWAPLCQINHGSEWHRLLTACAGFFNI